MGWPITKYAVTAAIVVLVSELAKRSDRLGFWPALLACVVITVACFGLFALALRRFGIELI